MCDLQKDLIIDEEFQDLIRPLTNEEYRLLEESILKDGCRDPIIIWQGIIVDGKNRYMICRQWDKPYKTTEKQFSCREEADQTESFRRNAQISDRQTV